MKLRRKLFAAVSSLAVAAAVLLAGCGAPAQEGTALKETGILTLSVNPEIQIEYNRDGKVTALTGRNDDGKGIVEAYPDYIGKDCEDVLKDLIVEINEAGYFVDDIDGNKKNIVLKRATLWMTSTATKRTSSCSWSRARYFPATIFWLI